MSDDVNPEEWDAFLYMTTLNTQCCDCEATEEGLALFIDIEEFREYLEDFGWKQIETCWNCPTCVRKWEASN